jgi:hypothetical protein
MGNITKEDIEFFRFIRSSVCDDFWEKDERGNRLKLLEGWGKAQSEYDRIVKATSYDGIAEDECQCVRP